jgi:photosystem II stability/assembly factor-like uncharacterized protein
LYPGGPDAYQAMLAKLDRLTVQAEQAQASSRTAEAQVSQSTDYGGGIYSWNASLHLLNSTVEFNVAGVNSDGHGGGIFVGQAAPSGVIIAHNVVQYNTASNYAEGKGGGLYLFQTPGAVVEHNQFLENAASNGGPFGVGGGLYVDDSAGVLVQLNHVERNTAHASWDCPGMGGGGIGGGAQFRSTDDAIVADNVFRDNLAALHCGSHGGGLYVYRAENVRLEGNQVIDNWGVLFQVYSDDFGGGLGVDSVYSATVSGNIVRGNVSSLVTPHEGMHVSYGGGIFGYALVDSQIASNEIKANVASSEWSGFGGGMHLVGTEGVVLADNLFADNAASLLASGDGRGGGVDVRNTVGTLVRHNHFVGNRGSADGVGVAGALNVESWGPHSFDTTVDANLFLDNQASGNPAARAKGGACIFVTHGFTFTNNVVAGNTAAEAGGLVLMAFEEGGVVTNNTLAENSDAAIVVGTWTTPVTFTNNIVVSHAVGISVTEGSTATVRYTLWDGNGVDIAGPGVVSQTHAVAGDPAFAYPAAHDYHLTAGSAAINAGDPAGVPPAPPDDADGVARPVGVAVDLGAYEWKGYWSYLPFVARDWRPYIGWAAGGAVGGYGTIIHTTDSGGTWVRQGTAEEIPDVHLGGTAAIDAQNAWVVGAPAGGYGTILRTRDGGRTWQRQGSPAEIPDAGLVAISAVDGNTAWAVGEHGDQGFILHTTDGGQTWTRQGQGIVPAVALEGAYASDADHAWVVGGDEPGEEYGRILRTSDGGTTWEKMPYTLTQEERSYYLITVHGYGANTLWAVGASQALHSADGGVTWANREPGVGLLDINGVYAVDHDSVWIVVDNGGIYRSDDRGLSWDQQAIPDGLGGDYVLRISAVDGQTAWAVTSPDPRKPSFPGHVLHTADGGQTWVAQTTPVAPAFWGVSFVK